MAAEGYRHSIHIDAEPEFVYTYFTQPEALVRWMGDRAILDPRPGGRFMLQFGERTVEGRYAELDPPNRLVISWGRVGSALFPPASSTLEVTFTPESGGTRVSIVHIGLPASELPPHARGWQHYLPRLAVVAAGGEIEEHVVPNALWQGVDRVPAEDPLAPPTVVRQVSARIGMSDAGVRCAAWYLRHVVPKVEPALSDWSGGRLTSLPIAPVVFLHTIGARTGHSRLTPLTYFTDNEDVILIASNYGHPHHPSWYFNVLAHPEVTLLSRQQGGRYIVHTTVGDERERLWRLATRWSPPFAKYQRMAGARTIPVVRCVPIC